MVQIKTDVQIKLSFNEHSIIKKYNFLAIISCEGIAGFLFICLFVYFHCGFIFQAWR